MEIERKWRLTGLPPTQVLRRARTEELLQGYLVTEPGEMRLRAVRPAGGFFLTVKADGGISRAEWETEIPEWVFRELWPRTFGRRVAKTRYRIPHGQGVLEVDAYHEGLAGLFVLECEFPSEAIAREFTLPDWTWDAVEVTAVPAYKNKALALDGPPK